MDAYGNMIVYVINTQVTVINFTNIQYPSTFYNMTLPVKADDIRIKPPYLIILTNEALKQFDLNLELEISSYSLTSTGWRIDILCE